MSRWHEQLRARQPCYAELLSQLPSFKTACQSTYRMRLGLLFEVVNKQLELGANRACDESAHTSVLLRDHLDHHHVGATWSSETSVFVHEHGGALNLFLAALLLV